MRLLSSLITLSVITALTTPVLAQSKPRLLGSYKKWDAMIVGSGRTKECFVISSPTKWAASKKGARRGDIYVTVTHRPQFKIVGEVNAVVGYPLKPSSEVTVNVDGRRKYTLFTEGNGAWAYDPKDDKTMVQNMKRGATMKIYGMSARGTRTTDTYSLSGFTAAYNAISRTCK